MSVPSGQDLAFLGQVELRVRVKRGNQVFSEFVAKVRGAR